MLRSFLCPDFIHISFQADERNCIFNLCRCDLGSINCGNFSVEILIGTEPGCCSRAVVMHPCDLCLIVFRDDVSYLKQKYVSQS